MKPTSVISRLGPVLGTAMMLACAAPAARAQSSNELSEASMAPVALSIGLPLVVVGGAASLVVTGVQASADGVVWVMENAADGSKASVRVSGEVVGGVLVAAGTVIQVTATGAGLLLSTAGKVVAFIPNEVGKAFLYNQKVSQ